MSMAWKSPYQAALREPNPEKVAALCQVARRAIHDRLIELGGDEQAAIRERETLDESLRQLFVRERTASSGAQA